MVNSLERYTIAARGAACNAGHYCVQRIETYGSFKPLMAMEFPIEHVFCQGCLTRPFANFVSVPLFLRVVIASPRRATPKERDDI